MVSAQPSDDASLLVLCVETSPALWEQPVSSCEGGVRCLGFRAFCEHVLVFVNAFLLLNGANRLVVLALHCDGCHLLYESPELRASPQEGEQGGCASRVLAERLAQLATAHHDGRLSPPLSAALSRALCYVQRAARGAGAAAPRLLCLHGSADCPGQYVAMMNAIFCAQSSAVPIDVCLLGDVESPFLQQAASLTGGVYLRPPRPQAFLQYLLSVFATDLLSRTQLRLPQPRGVDFRASCFCHKRAVDVGFVCSVCLSIYCAQGSECTTCGTEFGAAK